MTSKYNLMLCELHNTTLHGMDEDSDPNIQSHYIVFDKYQPFNEDYFDVLDDEPEEIYDGATVMQRDIQFLKRLYVYQIQNHTSPIRNYNYIISRPNYIKPEIGEVVLLPTLEEIAILKTFWLRIIQKKWKKVFQERKRILHLRSNPLSILHNRIYGKWADNCDYLPGLHGMFYITLNFLLP